MLNIAPTATPPALTIDEAKLHLRVEESAEDALILSLIVAATAAAEHETGRKLVTQTWQAWLPGWPDAATIALAQTPASAVVIKYDDPAGVQQTLPDADYVLIAGDVPAIIRTSPAWPGVSSASPYPVRLTVTAGYGAAPNVPEPIRQWIKLRLGTMYMQREAHIAGVSVTETPYVDRLLDRYRTWRA